MRGLTLEQYHRQVLLALSTLCLSVKGVHSHSAGKEYTSLMSCFLMHTVSGARSLLALYESSGVDWFPVTVGYGIARSMFEIDITAHYISLLPQERSSQYILFEHVLNKQAMDACNKHRKSRNSSWREAMEIEWSEKWSKREQDINDKFSEVKQLFSRIGKNGKEFLFQNWSGKSIRQLASEVDHVEAYDTFYSPLSSFVHADVHLANKFLHLSQNSLSWTQRANQYDVGEVFHDAASFMSCYMELFGLQFGVWTDDAIRVCWEN